VVNFPFSILLVGLKWRLDYSSALVRNSEYAAVVSVDRYVEIFGKGESDFTDLWISNGPICRDREFKKPFPEFWNPLGRHDRSFQPQSHFSDDSLRGNALASMAQLQGLAE
jgi:hypothetical protein